MKVVEVISDMNIGGAGILLINRMKNTDLNKYRTTVVVPAGSLLRKRFEDIGVRCIEVNCKGDSSFGMDAVLKYMSILKDLKPDIVNTHGCLSARLAAKLIGVPVKLCTRHCYFAEGKKHLLRRLGSRLSAELSDGFIAVADIVKKQMTDNGVPEEKITVIINGAEALERSTEEESSRLKSCLSIKDGVCVLGICARLEVCKGHEWLFETLRILVDDGEEIVALVIGDGSRRAELERLSEQYGIGESVRFVGFQKNVSPYMSIIDINVNCSVGTETSSLALSEGMSIGKPAVVSDFGGNPYMVRHGENGFVCRCYDSSQMAKYIKKLLHDKELYSSMCKAALKRFEEELNAREMTKKTNLLYDSMLRDCLRADR